MSDNPPPPPGPTPQEEADRIRLKRLAKLGGGGASGSASPAPSATPGASSSSTPAPKPVAAPVTRPVAAPRKVVAAPAPAPVPQPRKAPVPPVAAPFEFGQWQHEAITTILNVTFDRDTADRNNWNVVWLKSLAEELSTSGSPPRIDADIIDQLLISRLELDPNMMSDDPEMLQVIASLPPKQTVFEYLVGCWKRLMLTRSQLVKRNYKPNDVALATPIIDKLRELIISYVGLILQTPDMFPQPDGRQTGAVELVDVLKGISSYSGPLLSSAATQALLPPGEIEVFIGDLGRRFDDDGLDDILAPVVEAIIFGNEGLRRPEGIAAGDGAWRQVIAALEVLVSSKPIAAMLPRLARWNPANLKPPQFEHLCLLGPLLRLHIMPREFPHITTSYFVGIEKRTRRDVESSQANLRATLTALQNALFQIFNTIVRSSPEAREGVLAFFASVLNMNWRRTGSHVDPRTVASDGFVLNCQAILLRLAEPFMDARYSKLDRVDPKYVAYSTRLDLKEQTRLKASSEEAAKWAESLPKPTAPPNFITEVFYLTAAFNHIGLQRVITGYGQLGRKVSDYRREAERAEGGPTVPEDAAAIQQMKDAASKGTDQLYCIETQLLDPEMVFRTLTFSGFVASWLVRIVDPRGQHPAVSVELPLPKEVPPTFAALPELLVEDILDFSIFLLRRSPELIHEVFRKELFEIILTFLTSLQYLNNPYHRAKLVQILYQGTDSYDRSSRGVLADQLQTNPMALRYLMKSLLEFYIDVEITGTHTQFWDKFDFRSNVSAIMQEIWVNPEHRQRLEEISHDTPFFTKFINLLMNDTTFMLDESVGKLYEVAEIQKKMANPEEWLARPQAERQDLDSQLRQMERYVPYFTKLADHNLALFKKFTIEAKGPFLTGEIVERLAAMLAYNLESLAGPRCSELKVKDMDKKWGFRPRDLLRDVMQVFINLSEEPDFIRAVATEGRSYSKDTFMRAHKFAVRYSLKSDKELTQFALFVEKAEAMRVTIEEEDDFEDIPEEFLDPLMYSLMKDPVTLPSSKTNIDIATIKAHLLSDPSDPFNRVPLKIEEVIPNPELKSKIQAFIADHRRKRREAKDAARTATAGDQPMDTGV